MQRNLYMFVAYVENGRLEWSSRARYHYSVILLLLSTIYHSCTLLCACILVYYLLFLLLPLLSSLNMYFY